MALISVAANDIDRAGVSIDAELPVAWLERELADADARAQMPGRIRARLSRSGTDEIIVRARVTTKASVPCARCLDPAPVDVDSELSLLLRPDPAAARAAQKKAKAQKAAEAGPAKPGSAAAKGSRRSSARATEYEFSSSEADVDLYDGETVVLDGFIREAILLEMPSFPLCSEACPGIPQSVGGKQNAVAAVLTRPAIDPRLAPLAQLKKRLARTDATARPASSGRPGRDRPAAAKRSKPAKAAPKASRTTAKRKSR